MLKFLVITFLIGFLIYKVFGFIFRMLIGSPTSGNSRESQNFQSRRPDDGNVNIDYVPKKDAKTRNPNDEFKGGEYVDFEEIK